MAANLEELQLPDELPAIPDGWHYDSLGDLVEERGVSYGIVQPGSESADGVPIVRVNNIRNGRIDTTNMLKVEADVEAKFQRSRLRGGEVLLTLVGTLGEVAIVPNNLSGWNVARAVGVIPVRKDPGSLWVAICLRSAFIQHCIRTWATTTVQATFNLRDVAKLPIPIPPKNTRDAIAAILGSLDDKIELNRRMNATLEEMARALFQSWFVDFDPVRAKLDGRKPVGLDEETAALFPSRLQDSPRGPIPATWRLGTIQDCCMQIQNGGTPRRNEPRFWDGGSIPWLASGEVRQPIIIGTERYITEDGLAESSAKWVPAFSTVVALYGATAGQVSLTSSRLTTNQAVCALIPKKPFEYFNYFTMRAATTDLESKAVGSAQQNISKGIVEESAVVLPPTVLVERFSQAASPLFDRWISNLHQSRTLAALRDTLLPKLLSGEVRIPDVPLT